MSIYFLELIISGPARKIEGLGHKIWPDGRVWAANKWPDLFWDGFGICYCSAGRPGPKWGKCPSFPEIRNNWYMGLSCNMAQDNSRLILHLTALSLSFISQKSKSVNPTHSQTQHLTALNSQRLKLNISLLSSLNSQRLKLNQKSSSR